MAQQQLKTAHRLDTVDPVWTRIRNEAEDVVRREPELASFIYSSILHHDRFETVVFEKPFGHRDVAGEKREVPARVRDDDFLLRVRDR